jgi:ABC-type sugar transport system ATPase subunit
MEVSLELRHITRQFPGVKALDDVCLTVGRSEIHALCGENGAGKSTLINIISGNLQPTSGQLLINGLPVALTTPLQARNQGIAVVHQEKSLVDSLSIAENIFAGQQPVNKYGFIDFRELHRQTDRLLKKLQLSLSPDTIVSRLSPSQKQLVEIAKALSQDPSILLLDEPTAAITEKETQLLFGIIRQLKTEGVAIIYISHRMAEIFAIADKVSVLKDGKYQGTKQVTDTTVDQLIKMMVGRNIQKMDTASQTREEAILEVKNITGKGFKDISFTIRKGEIVGLAGLIGSGRTEIAKALFGEFPVTSGEIWVNGKLAGIRSIPQAISAGIGLLPEERKSEGIFAGMTVEENIIAASLPSASNKGWFSAKKMHAIAGAYSSRLRITSHNADQKISTLSGGNQQKIVLSKWLLRDPDVLIFDEPTHGVDIGVKFEIYQLLREQAARGKGILLISSELPELLLLSDTVLVVRNGAITHTMERSEATEENIMQAACGF